MSNSFESFPKPGTNKSRESPDLVKFRETTETIGIPGEKLKFLITEFDKTVFSDNPTEVIIESEPEEPWGEGEEVWLSGHEEEGGKKRWVYEMNPEMKEDNFDELLGMAVHEVRHRVQREAGIEITTDQGDFETRMEKFPKLNTYREKIIEYAGELAEKRKQAEGKLPPEIEGQEFDALVSEIVAPAMMKRGMSAQEVGDEMIRADITEMLDNLDRRL